MAALPAELGKVATVIRFDERGHGLSDREVTDYSLEKRVADLEAVADHAGLDRFALIAMAQAGPVAAGYADRHPDRLTRLMFYGSYAAADAERDAGGGRARRRLPGPDQGGLGAPDPEFRRVFTTLMIPGASEEQMSWVDELQRMAATAETAYAGPPAAHARPTPGTCCSTSTCPHWCCTAAGTG